jgi:hypothetical protein
MAKGQRGGARPNSGPAKGTKYAPTLTKEAAREALRLIVLNDMQELVGAQLANAKGIKYLVVREKSSGKFLRVNELRAAALKADEEVIEIWEKDPSVQAFTDLMNRALDKPKEQEQQLVVSGALNLDVRIREARKRISEK